MRERAGALYGRLGGNEFVKQGTPLLVATALASLSVYGFHFFVSRRLGVDAYGIIASLISAVTLVNAAFAVGATIAARFAAEFAALGEMGKVRRLLDLLALWCALFFAVSTAGAVVFQVPLAAFLRLPSSSFVVLSVILAALTVAAVLMRGLLQGMQSFVPFSISFIIEQVGRAVVASLFVFIGYGVGGALAGSIAAACAATGYTYILLRSILRVPAEKLRLDLRRLVTASGAIAIATISLAMLAYFDLILAKHYLTPHDAGLYGFAILPGRALYAVISFLPTWMLPKATEQAAVGKRGLGTLGATLAIGGVLGLVAVALLYWFAAPLVVGIAGPAFAQAAPLVFPYGCAAAIFTLTSIAAAYQMGRHRFDFVVPLVLVVIAEVVAIAVFHSSAGQIVLIVLGANVLAFFAAVFRITAPAG